MRYCDLVHDLEGTARRMLAHCGLPWEDGGEGAACHARTQPAAQPRHRSLCACMLRCCSDCSLHAAQPHSLAVLRFYETKRQVATASLNQVRMLLENGGAELVGEHG